MTPDLSKTVDHYHKQSCLFLQAKQSMGRKFQIELANTVKWAGQFTLHNDPCKCSRCCFQHFPKLARQHRTENTQIFRVLIPCPDKNGAIVFNCNKPLTDESMKINVSRDKYLTIIQKNNVHVSCAWCFQQFVFILTQQEHNGLISPFQGS